MHLTHMLHMHTLHINTTHITCTDTSHRQKHHTPLSPQQYHLHRHPTHIDKNRTHTYHRSSLLDRNKGGFSDGFFVCSYIPKQSRVNIKNNNNNSKVREINANNFYRCHSFLAPRGRRHAGAGAHVSFRPELLSESCSPNTAQRERQRFLSPSSFRTLQKVSEFLP